MFPSSHIGCTHCPKAPPSGDWTSQTKPICAWWSLEWKCSRAHTLHSHKTLGKRRGLVAMGRSCNSSNYLEINRLWAWRFRWKEHTNLLWESRFGVELRSPCDEGVSSGENKDCPSGQYPSLKDGSVSLETYNRIARFLLHSRFSTLGQSKR